MLYPGKMADGILMVVQPGVVDSGSAASAKEFLKQSGQNVLGQVVNGVNSENQHSYYYAKNTTSRKILQQIKRLPNTKTTANHPKPKTL